MQFGLLLAFFLQGILLPICCCWNVIWIFCPCIKNGPSLVIDRVMVALLKPEIWSIAWTTVIDVNSIFAGFPLQIKGSEVLLSSNLRMKVTPVAPISISHIWSVIKELCFPFSSAEHDSWNFSWIIPLNKKMSERIPSSCNTFHTLGNLYSNRLIYHNKYASFVQRDP